MIGSDTTEPSSGGPAGAGLAVLVVDDQPQNLLAFEAALAPLAVEVVTAGSGEEAVRMTAARSFATILMDVRMPGMDGFEAAEMIRSREDGDLVPIVFVSAIDRELAHLERGYAAGAFDYLMKPVDDRVLRAKVSGLVQTWRRSRLARLARERRHQEADAAALHCRAVLAHLDQAPLLVWTTDETGVPHYRNRRCREYVPSSADGADLDCLPAVHPDDRQAAIEAWAKAVSSRQPDAVTVRLRSPVGEQHASHSLQFAPVTIEGGERGWTVVAWPLERANSLLAWVGHELRNPLNAIKGGLTLKRVRHAELTDIDRLMDRQLERLQALSDELARPESFADPVPNVAVGDVRVLVVDDNPDGASMLAEILRALGATVQVALDGKQAIRTAARFAPTAAVVDIGLPDTDGRDLGRRLRAQSRIPMKLYAISGFGSEEDRRLSLEAGFEQHLVKPFDATVLAGALGLHPQR